MYIYIIFNRTRKMVAKKLVICRLKFLGKFTYVGIIKMIKIVKKTTTTNNNV